MITSATGTGTPMCRWVHLPIVGASLSRKKRLRTVKDTNTARGMSVRIPRATPSRSAFTPALIDELASWFACPAVVSFTPRSLIQPSIFPAALCKCWLRVSA